MKYHIFLIALLTLSCKTRSKLMTGELMDSDSSILIKKELNQFLIEFERQVVKGQVKNLFDYIDPAYSKEQLENLEGRKKQFVNELFCGNVEGLAEFKCIKLNDIHSVDLLSLDIAGSDLYLATYRIQSKLNKIIVQWTLTKNESKHGFGFIGAYG